MKYEWGIFFPKGVAMDVAVKELLSLQHFLVVNLLTLVCCESQRHSGLRYEDLLNEDQKEVKEALEHADPDVLTARTRRLKRAIDLSFKRKSLQHYAPDMELDIFKREIYPDIEKIRARDNEYAQLNAHKSQ